jgi:hypothetical protein
MHVSWQSNPTFAACRTKLHQPAGAETYRRFDPVRTVSNEPFQPGLKSQLEQLT